MSVFLTTIRVRRPRTRNLQRGTAYGNLPQNRREQLVKLTRAGELLEVMVHGKPVALLHPTDTSKVAWTDPRATQDVLDAIPAAVNASVKLMGAAQEAGLTSERESAEA